MRTILPWTHSVGLAGLVSVGLLAVGGTAAQAACLSSGCSQNGLVFGEASSSFKITDVTGLGTIENPFVVYQDVWGLDISLSVSGLPDARQHSVFQRPGFAISIVSRNLTGAFWRFYDHELQETAGVPSGENDGLSFAQGLGHARPYTSDRYTQADEVTDTRDFINFYRGAGVESGASVRFNYFITDTIPNQRFYIRQRPDYRTNTIPTATIPTATVQPPVTPSHRGVQPTPGTNPIAPAVTAPQPIPQPVSPSPSGVTLKKPATPPQSVPEPSSSVMGVLTIFLGKFIRHSQRLNPTKP